MLWFRWVRNGTTFNSNFGWLMNWLIRRAWDRSRRRCKRGILWGLVFCCYPVRPRICRSPHTVTTRAYCKLDWVFRIWVSTTYPHRCSWPFGILIIITFSVPQVHWVLVWGHVDKGLPGRLTLIINLSKCSHFVERWPRMHGSLEVIGKHLLFERLG